MTEDAFRPRLVFCVSKCFVTVNDEGSCISGHNI